MTSEMAGPPEEGTGITHDRCGFLLACPCWTAGAASQRAHIDALTAKVEALPHVEDEDVEDWTWVSRSDVLAILRGEA